MVCVLCTAVLLQRRLVNSATMGAWRLLDLYPKIPTDLSQSTVVGGWFSTLTGVIMLLLFQVELFSFMSAPIESQVVVDNVLETKVRQEDFRVTAAKGTGTVRTVSPEGNIGF